MSVPDQFLLIVDFPGIKQFVFGTDRLVEIRGGSGILDHLNRIVLPEFLKKEMGESNVDCVYVGGGAGQFVVKGQKEFVEKVLQRLQRLCREKSGGGLHMLYTLTPFAEDYARTKNLAYQHLRRRKEEEPLRTTVVNHVGFIRECDSCSEYAANIVAHGGSKSLLCASCASKTRFGQDNVRGLWKEFSEHMTRYGYDQKAISAAIPSDFQEVGESCTAKKGHVGLIYADGNSMGRLVKQLDSIENFSFFSKTVDTAIREACYEALGRHCLPGGRVDHLIPALILLLGGDDLLVYTPADLAVPVAMEAAQLFERKTQEAFQNNSYFWKKLSGRGLTLSIGIAFGRAQTPFSILLNQAEELLKSAKVQGSLDDRCTDYYAPCYVDYHFTARYNHIRAMDCRQEHLVLRGPGETLHLTNRPYPLEDMAALWDQSLILSQSGIPRSRMERLGVLPALGRVRANLEFYSILGRTKGNVDGTPRKTVLWKALERFGCRLDDAPWIKKGQDWATVLGDLMELTEITPNA